MNYHIYMRLHNRSYSRAAGQLCITVLLSMLCVFATANPAMAEMVIEPADCVDCDVLLRAGSMRYFDESSEAGTSGIKNAVVSVLEDSPIIMIGTRKLSADRAVVWSYARELSDATYRRIEVYLEGDVTVTESYGSVTRDNSLLVIVMQTGEFTADAKYAYKLIGTRPDVYDRAVEYRKTLNENQRRTENAKQARPGAVLFLPQPTPATPATPVTPVTPTTPQANEAANAAHQAEKAAAPQTTPEPHVAAAAPPATPAIASEIAAEATKNTPPAAKKKTLRQPVRYSADSVSIAADTTDKNAANTIICKGNIILSYGGVNQVPPVDIQADAAVLFTGTGDQGSNPMSRANIAGAYLEGDVRMTSEDRIIRAEKLYMDFDNERAVILDAVFHGMRHEENLPIYIRAKKVRMLTRRNPDGTIESRDIISGSARISTSEFYSPTYHIGASSALLSDKTQRDQTGKAQSENDTDLAIYNPTINIYGLPMMYWPKMTGNANDIDLPLSHISQTRDRELDNGVKTRWDFMKLLGLRNPKGFSSELDFDFYEFGVDAGIALEYERGDYSGFFEGYYRNDHDGTIKYPEPWRTLIGDELDVPESRYYLLWRHKHHLGDGWEIQAELADERGALTYSKDRSQFWEDKARESILYIRKQQDNWAISTLGRADFTDKYSEMQFWQETPTPTAPELRYDLVGQSLLGNTSTLFVNTRAGMYRPTNIWHAKTNRWKPDTFMWQTRTFNKTNKFEPDASGRMELDLPLKFGPINLVATTGIQATGTKDIYGYNMHGYFASAKANTSLWRVWPDAHCRLLDINGIRHIVTPEAIVYWHGLTTQEKEFHPIFDRASRYDDDIEQYGSSLRLRQRWQTHRGPAGKRYVADLAGVNLALNFYSEPDSLQNNTIGYHKNFPSDSIGRFRFDRPEESRMNNNFTGDFHFNFSDSTTLLGDMVYGLNKKKIHWANIGLAVQRDPRLRYYLGTRFINDIDDYEDDAPNQWNDDNFGHDSVVGTAGFTYNLTRKYELTVFQQYDFMFKGGKALKSRVTLIRKFPRWLLGITLFTDKADGLKGFEISLWPQGMPNLQLGTGSRMSTWATEGMN